MIDLTHIHSPLCSVCYFFNGGCTQAREVLVGQNKGVLIQLVSKTAS